MSTNGLMNSLVGRVRRNTSPSDSQEDHAIFAARFSRCYRPLLFIGRRVLGGPEGVEAAIENCWFATCRNPPRFEAEGAFRSWLLRVLIDEALAILRKNRTAKVVGDES
jgi:DNA-directed RNA polymerase specialized sigma24 family protein